MTQESYTLANGNTLHTLSGTWFDEDGFCDDLALRHALVEVSADGKLWDAEVGGRIRIVDGTLHFDHRVPTFVPDAGELDRIGAQL